MRYPTRTAITPYRLFHILVTGLVLFPNYVSAQTQLTITLSPTAEAVIRDGGGYGQFDGVFDAIVGPVATDPIIPGYLLGNYNLVADHRTVAQNFGFAILPPHEDRSVLEFDLATTSLVSSATLKLQLIGRGGQPRLYIYGGDGNGETTIEDVQLLPPLAASVQLTNDNNANDVALANIDVTAAVQALVSGGKRYARFVLLLQPDVGSVVFVGSGSPSGPCCGPKLTITGIFGNTQEGVGMVVETSANLPDGTIGTVTLTFDSVETTGDTMVSAAAQGPPASSGFKLTNPPIYYEISTTATFTGSVRVCLGWAEGQIANESRVRMFHYEGNQWVDITDPTSPDTANNTVFGTTSSFSAFTLMEVRHPFAGFFQPVDNLPTVNAVKAGAAVPVKFSLGGDLGLDIFASGYPQSKLMQCETGEPIAAVEETVNAGGSSLSYDATTGLYTYVWKTQKAWGNSCRELQVELNDGEIYTARFTLRK